MFEYQPCIYYVTMKPIGKVSPEEFMAQYRDRLERIISDMSCGYHKVSMVLLGGWSIIMFSHLNLAGYILTAFQDLDAAIKHFSYEGPEPWNNSAPMLKAVSSALQCRVWKRHEFMRTDKAPRPRRYRISARKLVNAKGTGVYHAGHVDLG